MRPKRNKWITLFDPHLHKALHISLVNGAQRLRFDSSGALSHTPPPCLSLIHTVPAFSVEAAVCASGSPPSTAAAHPTGHAQYTDVTAT